MIITLSYEISIDLNKYLMRKKITLFAIFSWFAPVEKKFNLFIQFLLNYKILNQTAIFLYNRYSVNIQIDVIDKIRPFYISFIILWVSFIKRLGRKSPGISESFVTVFWDFTIISKISQTISFKIEYNY